MNYEEKRWIHSFHNSVCIIMVSIVSLTGKHSFEKVTDIEENLNLETYSIMEGLLFTLDSSFLL